MKDKLWAPLKKITLEEFKKLYPDDRDEDEDLRNRELEEKK